MSRTLGTRDAAQQVGRIVLSDEIVPLASLRPTLFFDEVLRPQDVAHNAMVGSPPRTT